MHTELDDVDWQLLQALQVDARAPLKVLAAAGGLSVAATSERLKRLRDQGLMARVGIDLEPAALGYGIRAVIGITVLQPYKKVLLDLLEVSAEVLECHHVAGEDSYLMMVVARDLPALEMFISRINGFGETRTSIILSSPIRRRGLVPPGRQRQAGR